MWVVDYIGHWLSTAQRDAWRWVASLDYQQWFLLLGVSAAAGFLCMKGMGSRKEY
jgi:hypothetical protein